MGDYLKVRRPARGVYDGNRPVRSAYTARLPGLQNGLCHYNLISYGL